MKKQSKSMPKDVGADRLAQAMKAGGKKLGGGAPKGKKFKGGK